MWTDTQVFIRASDDDELLDLTILYDHSICLCRYISMHTTAYLYITLLSILPIPSSHRIFSPISITDDDHTKRVISSVHRL